jgi:segregation and condensation protein B
MPKAQPHTAPSDLTAEPVDGPAIDVSAADASTATAASAESDTATDAPADTSTADTSASAAAEPSPELVSKAEALLFTTRSPLTAGRIAELLELDSTKPVRTAISILNKQYESAGRCFRIEQVAGGYQMLTLPEFGELLQKQHRKEVDAKITKAALETLAIIAYKQPILRVDVEGIRGVACGETIRSLMEKHLVKIAGRAEEPGRPILYGTTKRFLEVFGLNSLKDLPKEDDRPLVPVMKAVVEVAPEASPAATEPAATEAVSA